MSLSEFGRDTLAIRAGIHRTEFGEHAEALFLTSSFVFENAAQAAARFANADGAFVYSRYCNPTVTAFEERLAALENAECCVATSSGMAAILGCVMSLMRAGEHIVASQSLFGATTQLFNNFLKKFGVETTYVPLTDLGAWESAIQTNTRMLFLETPSNPLLEVADVGEIAKLARNKGVLLVVDNCLCTPALQQPLALGADIVIHSATKYLDGQGRVLGGAVLGKKSLIEEPMIAFLRNAGATLSPFNAWVILKGLETLSIRMEAQSQRALQLAQWLRSQPRVKNVFYPGLASHPQYALAKRQQRLGGAVVSFEVEGGREGAWKVIDSTEMISITANLGDTKSTITHPASTTHGRVSTQAREAAGISEGLVRVAVGLESIEDIERDLARGL